MCIRASTHTRTIMLHGFCAAWRVLAVLVLALSLLSSAFAQDETSDEPDSPLLIEMIDQLDRLRQEVQELRSKNEELEHRVEILQTFQKQHTEMHQAATTTSELLPPAVQTPSEQHHPPNTPNLSLIHI